MSYDQRVTKPFTRGLHAVLHLFAQLAFGLFQPDIYFLPLRTSSFTNYHSHHVKLTIPWANQINRVKPSFRPHTTLARLGFFLIICDNTFNYTTPDDKPKMLVGLSQIEPQVRHRDIGAQRVDNRSLAAGNPGIPMLT